MYGNCVLILFLRNETKDDTREQNIHVGHCHLPYEWESFQFLCLYNMPAEHFPYSHHWKQGNILDNVTYKNQDKNRISIEIRDTLLDKWNKHFGNQVIDEKCRSCKKNLNVRLTSWWQRRHITSCRNQRHYTQILCTHQKLSCCNNN